MIHNLLVAVDRDDIVPELVAAVTQLLRDIAVDVVVLHVRERQPRGRSLFPPEDAAELVNRTVSRLRRNGIHARGRVQSSLPSGVPQVILGVAEEEGAEAIVMGTYRRSRFLRWLLGSVSRGVLEKAQLPVFVVPVGEGNHTRTRDSGLPAGRSARVVAVNFAASLRRPTSK